MIPAMTDPLGKHWDQPRDICDAPMDEKLVLLTPRQFDDLPEYSASMPSGVYPGKCWKRQEYKRVEIDGELRMEPTGKWWIGWYGESSKGPGWCSNNWREIAVVA